MRRADRLFHLVQVLRARGFRTAAQLGEELGVSPRTVYRDVRDLVSTGVPIEGEPGVGYRLGHGYEMPPMTLNALEIEAVVLGARMVQAWADDELASAARTAVAKVEAVLPAPLRAVLLRTALFAPTRHWAQHAAGDLSHLRRAITEQRKLAIHYRRADGQTSERVIRPLGLYFWGNRWSLAAYCELRRAYRNFRPDRLHRLTALNEHFDGSDGIHLDAFIRQMEAETEAHADEARTRSPEHPAGSEERL